MAQRQVGTVIIDDRPSSAPAQYVGGGFIINGELQAGNVMAMSGMSGLSAMCSFLIQVSVWGCLAYQRLVG